MWTNAYLITKPYSQEITFKSSLPTLTPLWSPNASPTKQIQIHISFQTASSTDRLVKKKIGHYFLSQKRELVSPLAGRGLFGHCGSDIRVGSWLVYFTREKVKQAKYAVSDTKSFASLKKDTGKNCLVELVRSDQ